MRYIYKNVNVLGIAYASFILKIVLLLYCCQKYWVFQNPHIFNQINEYDQISVCTYIGIVARRTS